MIYITAINYFSKGVFLGTYLNNYFIEEYLLNINEFLHNFKSL